MITANVFQRIFKISFQMSSGTAFAIDVDRRQYVVTARHVCEGIRDGDTLAVQNLDTIEDWVVRIVGAGATDTLATDVIVMAPERQVAPALPMPATSEGLGWGQEVFFLGFPLNLPASIAMHSGYPLPFIKRATMSGRGRYGNENYVMLDGHNNPGFSGSPVVFRPHQSPPNAPFQVLGIVSAYHTAAQRVRGASGAEELFADANAGLMICPRIEVATDLIALNPIGAIIAE